jgi:LmbE family N-acetylglucosaminyl deacetylase
MSGREILCVIAHPDDLELMAGGSIARWIESGASVHVLTFSDGVWTAPDGRLMRDSEEALAEERSAAASLGYSVENLRLPAMNLQFSDSHVLEVLRRIGKYRPDTLLCPWSGDLHHDHEVVARVTESASRRVPRVLMGQINYYLRAHFTPNVFVDISDTWDKKIKALECFSSQWRRAGDDWKEYLDITSRYYGKIAGVHRAEGFVSVKYLE